MEVKRGPVLKSFSIRHPSFNGSASQQQTQTTDPETDKNREPLADKEVDNVQLMVAWREFAAALPQEDTAMKLQMDNMEPTMQEDGKTFLVIVDNPSILNELGKMKSRIEPFLHQRLQNYSLAMATRLREVTDKRRALSRVEQLNEMLEQSEALRKLKEEFELELT